MKILFIWTLMAPNRLLYFYFMQACKCILSNHCILSYFIQGILGSVQSGKSALVHRYLTGSYMQEESPEGCNFIKIISNIYCCINPFTAAIGPDNFRAYLRAYLNNQITSDFLFKGLYRKLIPCSSIY